MKKYPPEHWEIIEQEKVELKQGFRSMPEAEFEIMEQDRRNKLKGKDEPR